MNQIKYIDVTETAKIIRTTLKSQFPDTKFSVQSHRSSGCTSISINWSNGAALKAVEKVIAFFEGIDFDGMKEITEYHTVDWQGERVCFSHYINCQRKTSRNFVERAYAYCQDQLADADQLKIVGSDINSRFDVDDYYEFQDVMLKANTILNESHGERVFDEAKETAEIITTELKQDDQVRLVEQSINEELQPSTKTVINLENYKTQKQSKQIDLAKNRLQDLYKTWVEQLLARHLLSEITDYHSWLTTHGEAVLEQQYKQFVARCLCEGLIQQIISFDFWKSLSGDNPGDVIPRRGDNPGDNLGDNL